ncbi:MAG: potassium transporter Kup [Candidatus Krumholzibacteria bacterium]|nr:potassium transporter Kup [Candidatus Krumholzibacteria bacterium]MDH4337761.1 potassium transporter Kup [Candidatus Krumholzibacteria bacterium]MDH5271176.1 potassium transporter Kup [Candidatus Krumholzibacteria bacterium]MDH5628440.1 potassium transporter Kup [Candidatus Krumholzibacteria bacterium]
MSHAAPEKNSRALTMVVAALGVVYGDIGTSPLYAIRECFHGPHAVAVTPEHILGVLSLVFWSLVIVISIKYLMVVMRADNQGEGGIIALMALVANLSGKPNRRQWLIVTLGLFGAALLYGDGMITPAISVLSAIEGLEVVTPVMQPYVVPITALILLGLFRLQRRGTGQIGKLFGPVTFVWMLALAVWGVISIVQSPVVFKAVNPMYGVRFLAEHGIHSVMTLGVVFLVVTGGEALYADMGHFGLAPIRRAWFSIVLPALALNYFGQGAFLMRSPEYAVNPFYHMFPEWALIPMLILATAATIIASQAVIAGAFSLTWQAAQLGFIPRMHVQHTSDEEIGQVYIPFVNTGLLIATIALVFGFKTSSNLASAYGLAVSTDMVITTILLFIAMHQVWKWNVFAALGVCLVFLVVDIAFFSANVIKIWDGGWFPLAIGVGILIVMTTWRTGRVLLEARVDERRTSFEELKKKRATVTRVRGTGVFLERDPSDVPPTVMRIQRHLNVMFDRVIILSLQTERVPRVPMSERLSVESLDDNMYRVVARYGFDEMPNVPRLLRRCREQGLEIDPSEVTYVMSRETLVATRRKGMAMWRERLFSFMARNSSLVSDTFRIPANHVLEIGAEIEL